MMIWMTGPTSHLAGCIRDFHICLLDRAAVALYMRLHFSQLSPEGNSWAYDQCPEQTAFHVHSYSPCVPSLDPALTSRLCPSSEKTFLHGVPEDLLHPSIFQRGRQDYPSGDHLGKGKSDPGRSCVHVTHNATMFP